MLCSHVHVCLATYAVNNESILKRDFFTGLNVCKPQFLNAVCSVCIYYTLFILSYVVIHLKSL